MEPGRDLLSASPLFEVSRIETPEQIEVDLPLAGVGTRACAYIIDLLIQVVPMVACAIALSPLVFAGDTPNIIDQEDGVPKWSLVVLAIISGIVFVINFGYFAFFEIISKGRTPGKQALGLRVMRDGGFGIDGRAALVRNLLRAVDILPGPYLLGIAAIFIGRSGKRIGDYAAGTIVVKERRPAAALISGEAAGTWSAAAGPAAPSSRARSTGGALSPAERALVVDFLGRRGGLEAQPRMRVANEIAKRIASRNGQPLPENSELFLEALVSDDHR